MKIRLLVSILLSASTWAQTNLPVTIQFNPRPPRPMYAPDVAAFLKAGGATNGLTVTQRDREIYRWQHHKLVSNGVVYVQTGWRITLTNNIDYARFWWLSSMGDRYGFKLPVSPDLVANQLIAATQRALEAKDAVAAGGIQLDAQAASFIFTTRTIEAVTAGKREADWGHPPAEYIPVREPIYERLR